MANHRTWRACALIVVAINVPLTALAQTPPSAGAPPPPPTASASTASTSPFAVPVPPKAPTAADLTSARSESDKAARLARMRMLEPAAQSFLKAYALAGRASDLLAAADALRDTSALGEALDAYRAVLANHEKQLGRADKARVPKQIEEIEAKSGVLTVEGEAGPSVSIDERFVGTMPLARPVRLAAGKHAVTVTRNGFEPLEAIVDITGRGTASVAARLVAVSTKGRLLVREKSGADLHVFVDGRDVGPAPFNGEVEAGPHRVSLKGPTLESKEEEVAVPLKKEIAVVLEAAPLGATVGVQVTPATADVQVDGKSVGQGSWKGPLKAGPHEIVVSAKGFKTDTRKFDVQPGAPAQFDFVLGSQKSAEELEAERARETYTGVYGGVAVFGTIAPSTAPATTACPMSVTCTQDTGAIGGGLLGQVGYSFGYFGINVIGAGLGDSGVRHRVNTTPVFDEKVGVISVAGFGGAGVRGMTHGDLARASAGVAGGVTYRSYSLQRTTTGTITDASGATESSTAPALLFDLELVLGPTPGTKFILGVVMLLDMQGDVTSPAITRNATQTTGGGAVSQTFAAVPLATGPTVYVGPMIGLRFGR